MGLITLFTTSYPICFFAYFSGPFVAEAHPDGGRVPVEFFSNGEVNCPLQLGLCEISTILKAEVLDIVEPCVSMSVPEHVLAGPDKHLLSAKDIKKAKAKRRVDKIKLDLQPVLVRSIEPMAAHKITAVCMRKFSALVHPYEAFSRRSASSQLRAGKEQHVNNNGRPAFLFRSGTFTTLHDSRTVHLKYEPSPQPAACGRFAAYK